MSLLDDVRDGNYLTADQLTAVESDGNFFLLSCPGSGKTRSAGVRFAHLADRGLSCRLRPFPASRCLIVQVSPDVGHGPGALQRPAGAN